MMTDEEFAGFLNTAVDDLQAKQDSLADSHGLGSYEQFWFDQEQASLDFRNAEGVTLVRARVVPVGSWAPRNKTWKWAWSNESLLPVLRDQSASLRALVDHTGMPVFERPIFEADEAMAWELTALAVRHLGAIGAYRAPSSTSNLYLAVMSVCRVAEDGWLS